MFPLNPVTAESPAAPAAVPAAAAFASAVDPAAFGQHLANVLGGGLAIAKPAEAKPAAPPTPPPADTAQQWLKNLEVSYRAAEARTRSEAEAAEKGKHSSAVEGALKAGDLARLQEALGKLEGFYQGQVSTKDQALKAIDARLHETVKATEIGRAAAGVRWANEHAARDGVEKLAARFETVADGQGNVLVREKGSGRPAAEAVRTLLEGDEFAHLLDASSRGKGGVGSGRAAAATGPSNSGAAVDYAEAVLQQVEAQKLQARAAGLVETPGLRALRAKK